MQRDRGVRAAERGVLGAVTVDTMGLFLPGRRVTTPGGNIRHAQLGGPLQRNRKAVGQHWRL